MSLTNVYHVRLVAETSAEACMICLKPSSTVMITPDNKDFFYVCPAHLQDRNFCTPIIDTEGDAERPNEETMARQIEQVEKEHKEKQRRKKKREKASEEKDEKKEKDEEENEKDESEDKEADSAGADNDQEERDNKQKDSSTKTTSNEAPRIFSLHETFYQMRIGRFIEFEMAKRNQARMRDLDFPPVPSGDPK